MLKDEFLTNLNCFIGRITHELNCYSRFIYDDGFDLFEDRSEIAGLYCYLHVYCPLDDGIMLGKYINKFGFIFSSASIEINDGKSEICFTFDLAEERAKVV